MVKPFDAILAGPNDRSRESAAKFGSYRETPSLDGWARATTEGQPADKVKAEMARLEERVKAVEERKAEAERRRAALAAHQRS